MKVLAQVPGTNETIMVQGEVQPVLLLLSEQDIETIRSMPDDNRWYLQYPGDEYMSEEEIQNWIAEVQGWLGDMQEAAQLASMQENLNNPMKTADELEQEPIDG